MFESVNYLQASATINWDGREYEIKHCVKAIQETPKGSMVYPFFILDVQGFCKTWMHIPSKENEKIRDVLFVGYHNVHLLIQKLRNVNNKDDLFNVAWKGRERSNKYRK